MELITQNTQVEDRQLLVVTHLSQLLTYVTGFGGFVVPLVIWLSKKETVANMDEHGKSIVNFQITMWLVALLSVPAIFLFGLGLLTLVFVGVLSLVIPIVNAVRASNGESPSYFMTIRFL